jgi:hypothetical protein
MAFQVVSVEEATKNITIVNMIILVAAISIAIAANIIYFQNTSSDIKFSTGDAVLAVGDRVGMLNDGTGTVAKVDTTGSLNVNTTMNHFEFDISNTYTSMIDLDKFVYLHGDSGKISIYSYTGLGEKISHDSSTTLTETGSNFFLTISNTGKQALLLDKTSPGNFDFTAYDLSNNYSQGTTVSVNFGGLVHNPEPPRCMHFFSNSNYGVFIGYNSGTLTYTFKGVHVSDNGTVTVGTTTTTSVFDSDRVNSVSTVGDISSTEMLLSHGNTKTYATVLALTGTGADMVITPSVQITIAPNLYTKVIPIKNITNSSLGIILSSSDFYESNTTILTNCTFLGSFIHVINTVVFEGLPMMEINSNNVISLTNGIISFQYNNDLQYGSGFITYTDSSSEPKVSLLPYKTLIPIKTEGSFVVMNSLVATIAQSDTDYTTVYESTSVSKDIIGQVVSVSGTSAVVSLYGTTQTYPNESFSKGQVYCVDDDGAFTKYFSTRYQLIGRAISDTQILRMNSQMFHA